MIGVLIGCMPKQTFAFSLTNPSYLKAGAAVLLLENVIEGSVSPEDALRKF